MPYIAKENRAQLLERPNNPMDAGELNYLITRLCVGYLNRSNMKYTDYNEIIGVLECAKQEFYRRAIVPYEDRKIIIAGDVY